MSKYRFKKREEFIRDGLWNDKYNCPDEWAWKGQMNKYLGMDVPDECTVYCDKNKEFEYDGWYFKKVDYILKEQQEYFNDLSQHIGRYIRALVDNPNSGNGVNKGDIGKIINGGQVDFPNRKMYNCTCALDKNNLGIKYELLPEDYSPEQEVKESNIEFIPGKWYRLDNWICKFTKLDKDRFCGFMINTSSNFIDRTGWLNIENYTPILIEDLSEIQEYLPEGHPDKVKNFKLEVGKWYSFNWDWSGKDRIVVAKIKEVDKENFIISWRSYLWNDNDYNDKDGYFFKDISNIKELSIKEIQPYLPIGHPDKIQSDEFKKGEYVVLIDKGQSTGSAALLEGGSTFIQNYCYKVRETKKHLTVELDSVGNTDNGWVCIPYNPNEFHKTRNWRYATQEEINEYEKRGKPYDVTELQKKELSMEEIQEECKKRFPIGCTYINTSETECVLKEDSYTYHIFAKTIWGHGGGGLLYENGKWAELVSLPEENITEVPEYVECFIPYGKAIPGKVYKTTDENESNKLFGLSWKQVLIDFDRLEDGRFKISNKEAYEQQKPLTYESVSGCFPTDKNMLLYDEVAQYPLTSSECWKNISKFVEQDFDIYGPTPDIE